MPNLTSLEIRSDHVRNNAIQHLTKLTTLKISFCSDIDNNGIKKLSSLTVLRINYNISEEYK